MEQLNDRLTQAYHINSPAGLIDSKTGFLARVPCIMDLKPRKPVFVVCNRVIHKSACLDTETR